MSQELPNCDEPKGLSMRSPSRAGPLAVLLLLALRLAASAPAHGRAEADSNSSITITLIGHVATSQDAPVNHAEVQVLVDGTPWAVTVDGETADATRTDRDGLYIVELTLPRALIAANTVAVEISKTGFRTARQEVPYQGIACLSDRCYVRMPDLLLVRSENAAFYLAAGIFVVVFGIISLGLLHETIAAFLGASSMLGISYLAGTFNPDFWIIGFDRAVDFIDLDVIFLIMTLMVVVSIMGRTGLFQWLALLAYRSARGSAWRLAIILMVTTAAMSAFLNNVTIMLLMAPITVEISLMLELTPTALIIPEALASNIGGIATLIGDPPNTVIGSYAGLGFNQFLVHTGPIALIATIALVGVVGLLYRREYSAARREPSAALLARLEKDAQITDPVTLRRALVVISMMVALFFASETLHMPPSVVGFIGATCLLIWVRPNVEDMLDEVDWTTLMFFVCLFIVVGGVQEVGLIQRIAELIAGLAGDDLSAATQAVIWLSAVASAIVNNIPFTTAFLPIAAFLTQTMPSANNVLYWSLSLGANLGGNATYVGSAPNVVAVGYLDRAGYHVSFVDWLRIGVPVTFVTLLVPALWIHVRYFLLHF
jgi:Na+/H+ antiporter NhaD/arsenite permease-like protein